MAKKILALVEGPTEYRFVKYNLNNYLFPKDE